MKKLTTAIKKPLSVAMLLLLLLWAITVNFNRTPQLPSTQPTPQTQGFIVQGHDINTLGKLVTGSGGHVTHRLAIIHAVGAMLTPDQHQALLKNPEIRAIHADRTMQSAHVHHHGPGTGLNADADYAARIQANALHDLNIDGSGITVAFIDSGIHHKFKNLKKDPQGKKRIVAEYDAIKNKANKKAKDKSGHGTHVVSVAIGSNVDDKKQQFTGIAPNASLVNVKAFNKNGQGTYLDVIRGLDWVVNHRQAYDIRVLNLSFSAPPQSLYWNDPLNQAVMAAWQAGIVVVASAGNSGPDAMTIGVPGNVPYVITVGAMSANKTSDNADDDTLTIFSSAGPTVEGFVKPDVVAPGGRLLGLMEKNSEIGKQYGQNFYDKDNFVMSGTSQATAVVTGTVALMLQQDPSLTPDQVKCRLLATAQPAISHQGALAYSVFQQGAGMVNAWQATHSNAADCANQNLQIQQDLQGVQHYAGPARRDHGGTYYLIGTQDYHWDGNYRAGTGYHWGDNHQWQGDYYGSSAESWNDGNMWQVGDMWQHGYAWEEGEMTKDGYMWRGTPGRKRGRGRAKGAWTDGLSETVSINHWVEE